MTETFALSGAGNLFKQEDFDFCAQMEAKLAAMTAERDDLAARLALESAGYRAASDQRNSAEMALKAMTARAELAERQVAVLCKRIAEVMYQNECPTGEDCEKYKDCSGCWAAWSRAEAAKGCK